MVIEGINNQRVEIRVNNYQFPETNDRDYDGNWLNIYLNVKSELGNWQTVDPSLLTWEVQELIDWLDQLSKNEKPKWKNMEFIEPNLCFHLMNSHDDLKKKIKIEFKLESRPRSANEDDEYFVEFIASNENLKNIANGFRSELSKFPVRLKKMPHNKAAQLGHTSATHNLCFYSINCTALRCAG